MRNPLALALAAAVGGALVLATAVVAGGWRGSSPARAAVDRAAIERALMEKVAPATGRTQRFDLIVSEAKWELLSGVSAQAVTFNGSVPGPLLRVTEGDQMEVAVTNRLAQPTSVHWHGLHVPNAQDGVAGITQDAIAPGAMFTGH